MHNLTSLDLLKISNLGEGEVISNPKIYVADFALSEKIATLLSENEGRRVSKAVWNFSENSPVLVTSPVPNPYDMPHEGDYKGGLK